MKQGAKIQQTRSAPKKRLLPPVFLLSGLIILACASFESVLLLKKSNQESNVKIVKVPTPEKQTSGDIRQANIFQNLHRKHPKYKPLIERLEQVNIQTFKHNLVWGNPQSDVELVIFNDLSCVSCRQEVKRVMKIFNKYKNQIHVVYKTSSPNSLDLDAEIFLQMAHRAGVGDSYFKEVLNKQRSLTEEEYMLALEKAGIDLRVMREIMRKDTRNIVRDIQKDLRQAQALGMPVHISLPAFYLNGYRLGQHYLPQHEFEGYLQRLVAGLPIVENH